MMKKSFTTNMTAQMAVEQRVQQPKNLPMGTDKAFLWPF